MAETGRSGPPAPSGGPSPQELEERWKEMIDVLSERPRDPELLIKAGQLSQQLGRKTEAYTYFQKALNLDPSRSFLVSHLRALAATPAQVEEVTRLSRRPASFEAGLGDIFKYPLRGKGLPILIMGALLMWVSRGMLRYGISTGGFTVGGVIAAYMAMFYIDVCHTTVGGDDQLPEWPDPLRLHEFGLDVGKFVCATLCSFLPVIVIIVAFGASLSSSDDREVRVAMHPPVRQAVHQPASDPDEDEPAKSPAPAAAPVVPPTPAPAAISPLAGEFVLTLIGVFVFGIVGLIYLPMATLANVVMGSPFTCFNFPFIFRSMGAASRNYMICLGCYFGVTMVVLAAETAVKIGGVIVFTGFALALLELYGMTVLMRLLGLFYRMSQAKLGWMAD
jgi:hypothetical protein